MERKFMKGMKGLKGIAKLGLMFIALVTLVLVVANFTSVFAATNVIVTGDLPDDSATYVIRAYDGASTDPCPGGVETPVATTTASATAGDPPNDNDDFSLSITSVSDLWIYYCVGVGSGDLRLSFHKGAVSSDTTYYIDLGKVIGTSLHADLEGDRVIVCDALNGNELSSERFDWNKVSGGSYTQFYAIDQGTTGDPALGSKAYVLFDTDVGSATCAFDATIETGKIVRLDSSSEKYGVYFTFAPDTKATGDMHSDFNADRGEIYGDSINIGIVYLANGQCMDTAHDDYALYYDKPASGTLRFDLYDGITTNLIEELDNLGLAFGMQDFVVDIHGTIPSDITKIDATDSNGVTYTVTPSAGSYNLYIADVNTITSPITVRFYKGTAEVFTKSVVVPSQALLCANDILLDLAKYYGTAHEDLKTGYEMEVYSDSGFTTLISDSSHPGDPDDTTGDYEVYFDATGAPQTYVLIDGATYDSKVFGKIPAAGEEILFDPNDRVGGTVHGDIDLVQIGNWNTFRQSKTDIFSGGQYYLYTEQTGATTINFYDSPTLVLTRTKSLSDVELDVAKLSGTIEAGFRAAGAGGTENIFVYDSYPSLPLNNLFFTADGGVGQDSYYLYFESTSSSLPQGVTDGQVDVKFADQNSPANNEFTLRHLVDDDKDDPTNDGITPGTTITLDMVNTLTGTLPISVARLDIVEYSGAVSIWTPVSLDITGTWPHTYTMYFDSIALTTGSAWNLDVYDNLYSIATLDKTLSRQKSAGNTNLMNGITFNVARVLGDAHSNLESAGDGADNMEVFANPDCTNELSSEDRQPADNGYIGGANDYIQYLETTIPGYEQYYLKSTMNDGNSFATCGNPFVINAGGTFAAHDIVVEKTGAVPDMINRVGIDLNQDNVDDAYTIDFEALVTGKEYHAFSVPDSDTSAWVHYYTDTAGLNKVLTLTDDLSVPGTHTNDVATISGQVPGGASPELNGGAVYAYLSQGKACGAPLDPNENSANVVDVGAVDSYSMFIKAAIPYYLVFCDSLGNKQYETFAGKTLSPGEQGTLDLAMISGRMDSDFATGANARIEVYDNFNSVQVGTTERSVHDGAGITNTELVTDYVVYFEQGGTEAAASALTDDSLDADSIADVALKITDNSNYVSWEIGIEETDDTTAFAAGDVKTVDLTVDITGDVPIDVDYVIVEDATSEYAIGIPAGDGTYQIYTRGSGNTISLEETTHTPSKVLTRSKAIADDMTFYAAKLASTIDSSFASSSGDMMQVYDDWTTASLLSSTSYVSDGSPDSYEVYFEDDSTIDNVDLKMTDSNSRVSWRLNVDEDNTNGNTVDAINEDGPTITDLALSNTLAGFAPAGITSIRISEYNAGVFVYTLSVGVTDGNDGYGYKIYFDDEANTGTNDWYLEAYSNPLQLKRLKVVNGNANALPDTFDVSAAKGDTHTNLNDNAFVDDIQVRDVANILGSGSLLSSESEQPLAASTPDYTQYFEHDGSSYFLVQAQDVDTSTYNSYARFAVAAGYTATVDLTYLLGGNTPSCEPGAVIWADDDANRVDDHPEYAAAVTAASYRLYHPYAPADTTSFWLRFDRGPDYTNDGLLFRNGGTMVLERQQALGQYSSTGGWNIALVYGTPHTNLIEADNDDIQVYLRNASNLPHELGAIQSSELADLDVYWQFFEQTQAGMVANYVMNISDIDPVINAAYQSNHRISTAGYGVCVNQDLDALKFGIVTEECTGDKQANVTITLLDSTGTTVLSTTNTYWDGTFTNDGTYRLYTASGIYDIKYEKPVFITQYLDDESLQNIEFEWPDFENNIILQYTVKISVEDQYGSPVTNANVTMINITNTSAVMTPFCEDGAGSYFIQADPALYPNVDFRIEKLWYETEFDDNGGLHWTLDNIAQHTANSWYSLDLDKNAVQLEMTSPASDSNLRGTVPLSSAEMSKYDETIFNDSLEDGNVYGWQSTGFWHITNRKANTGSFSWWYGQESTGGYNGTANSGNLTTKSIDLTGLNDASLSFRTWWMVEAGDPVNYDLINVFVSTDEGSTWTGILKLNPDSDPGCSSFFGSGGCDSAVWVQKTIDLTPYAGSRVLVRFSFDTVDNTLNDYEGWYVDDVKITTSAGVFDNVTFQYAPANGTISESDWVTIGMDANGADGWSASWDTTSMGDGLYELRTFGKEVHYGLVVEDYVTGLNVDNTDPVISGVAASNYYKNGDTVILDIDTDGTGYTVSADLSALDSRYVRESEHAQDDGDNTYTLSYIISQNNANADGTKTITVTSMDEAGNAYTYDVDTVLDNTPPAVALTSPAQASFNSGSITLIATASDTNGVTKVEFYVDDAKVGEDSSSPYSIAWDTGTVPDGVHVIKAKAYDSSVGNIGTNDGVAIVVDNTAPLTVVVVAPLNGSYIGGTIYAEAAVADAIDVDEVEFYKDSDGAPFDTDTSSVDGWRGSLNTVSISDGMHSVKAKVYDKTGHVRTSNLIYFTVDNNPPGTPSDFGHTGDQIAGYDYDRDGTVTWFWWPSSDSGSGIDHYVFDFNGDFVVVYGTQNPEGWITYTISDLFNYDYSVRVKAVDKMGRESDWTDWDEVIVDTTPPSPVTIEALNTEKDDIYDTNGNYRIQWSGGDDTNFAVYNLYRDGGILSSYPFTTKFRDESGMADGTYKYRVDAVDYAGWVTSSEEITVIVDKVSPSITLSGTSGFAGFWTFGYTVSDPSPSSGIDKVVVSDSDTSWVGCFQTSEFSGWCMVVGGTYVELAVYDKAGRSDWADTNGQEADTTPPMITYSSPSGLVSSSSVTLRVDTDEEAECYYGIEDDLSSMSSMDTPDGIVHEADLGSLYDGYYVYHVQCEDNTGNLMEHSKTIVFLIDTSNNFDFTIPGQGYLENGWNTFFLPKLILDDIDFNCGTEPYPVEDVLDSLYNGGAKFGALWYYDQNGIWRVHKPGYAYNTLLYFNDEISNPYFIQITESNSRIEIDGGC